MQLDATSLVSFYETPMGQIARRQIMQRLRGLWPDVTAQRVLGYGFATPYLRPFLAEAERVITVMPAQQGVVVWPGTSRVLSVLGEEDALPFPDAMFDRIVMVHALEAAEAARPLMRQIWRILAPAGRLVLIAPNRTSLWAQVEASPFAHGRPFTRGQLATVLSDSLFMAERWDSALMMPPLTSRRLIRSGKGWERVGRHLWPRLAGVHIVEASKMLYGAPNHIPARNRRKAFASAAG